MLNHKSQSHKVCSACIIDASVEGEGYAQRKWSQRTAIKTERTVSVLRAKQSSGPASIHTEVKCKFPYINKQSVVMEESTRHPSLGGARRSRPSRRSVCDGQNLLCGSRAHRALNRRKIQKSEWRSSRQLLLLFLKISGLSQKLTYF